MTREDAVKLCEPLFRDAYETGLRGEPIVLSYMDEELRKEILERSGHEADEETVKFFNAAVRGMRRMYDYGCEDAEKGAEES